MANQQVRAFAARALKTSAGTADRLRGPRRGVVVLIYHRVGAGSGLQLDLPLARFDEQMAELADSGRVTTLDAAVRVLAEPEPPTLDPIVVTFDDGPADFADVTLPVLERYGIPATMYLATAYLEEQREFSYGAPPMSWASMRDTMTTGLVTVGSHTHTHALLDRIGDEQVAEELDTSIALIEDRLGVTPEHFAYPKSVAPSDSADRAVRQRFRSAALAGTRPNPYRSTDPHRLARSPIQAGDEMRWFRAKVAGGMAFEDTVRRTVNRWRYSGAES
ncbi:MAG: polysaccharide deacetylase family protein [Acidimicrobiia bacterium]